MRKLDEEVRQIQDDGPGSLNVTVSLLAAVRIIPAMIEQFRRRLPGAHAQISRGYPSSTLFPLRSSETIKFIAAQAGKDWLALMSFIKPHWPYFVPAPYRDMFGANRVAQIKRHPAERDNPHPVYGAFITTRSTPPSSRMSCARR